MDFASVGLRSAKQKKEEATAVSETISIASDDSSFSVLFFCRGRITYENVNVSLPLAIGNLHLSPWPIYYGYILFMNKHALVSPRRVDRDHLIPSPLLFRLRLSFLHYNIQFFSVAPLPLLPSFQFSPNPNRQTHRQ